MRIVHLYLYVYLFRRPFPGTPCPGQRPWYRADVERAEPSLP